MGNEFDWVLCFTLRKRPSDAKTVYKLSKFTNEESFKVLSFMKENSSSLRRVFGYIQICFFFNLADERANVYCGWNRGKNFYYKFKGWHISADEVKKNLLRNYGASEIKVNF